MTDRITTIYTDGACPNNGSPFARAGWGAVLRSSEGNTLELAGPVPEDEPQTNSRAELTAIVRALQALKRPGNVELYTDSKYIADSYAQYLDGWKAKGWRKSDGKPVAHDDLWQVIDQQRQRHQLRIHWVKGHSGDVGNERAGLLANLGATGKQVSKRTRKGIQAETEA